MQLMVVAFVKATCRHWNVHKLNNTVRPKSYNTYVYIVNRFTVAFSGAGTSGRSWIRFDLAANKLTGRLSTSFCRVAKPAEGRK